MAPRKVRARPKRPEDVVEASLQARPARRAVLELSTRSLGSLREELERLGVRLSCADLDAQLAEAGFDLHGSAAARSRASAAGLDEIARELSGALTGGAPVFWARTVAGPRLEPGPLDLERLRAAGLGVGGAVLNVGSPDRLPALVAAALLAWQRGPGRRGAGGALWLATGGAEDRFAAGKWQASLQRVADEAQTPLHVRHFPAGIARWLKPRVQLARFDTVAPGGRTLVTTLARVYARRPPRAPAPVRVDVGEARAAEGRRLVKAEGRPASRRYVIRPRG